MAELFDFADSDGEIPDIGLSVAIQPYKFEPTRSQNEEESGKSSPESAPDSDEENEVAHLDDANNESEVMNVDEWCSCGSCTSMPTRKENKCCQNTNIVDAKVEEEEIDCITEHEGFIVNCLNRYVLETSYYEHMQENGPLQDGELIHEVYRYVAYRKFVRWIWQRLGKQNRRILPSCVVTQIRETFPSEQYCGFKYPN